jgi:alkylation response protein AidB-like acyl-CoA dehydrogenase
MDFSLSEDQEMLKTMAHDFLEKENPEAKVREIRNSELGYDPALWKKIADLGWMGIGFPEAYGGTGGTALDMMVIHEEMGRFLYESPFLSTVTLCGGVIVSAGTEEQKKSFIPKIIKGEMIIAMALTEPDSAWVCKAWDPEGVTVKATAQGDDYVIDGVKLFVHDAHVADYLLVATRTKESKNPEEGITLFLVDKKSQGISTELLITTMSKNKQCEVVFNKVKVSKKNMVGKLNEGWAPLFKAIQRGSVMVSAEMVGAGERVLDMTVDYSKTRIQFDMPIGVHQHVQEHSVQIVAAYDPSRRLTEYAAWALDQPGNWDLEIAAAKAWSSWGHEEVNWRAHQVFAGVGTMDRLHILPFFTRRGFMLEHYLGDSDYWYEKMAVELEKLPVHPKTKGKATGIWDLDRKLVPSWEVWRNYKDSVD